MPLRPAARITDHTAHGGVIVEGDPTVLIGNKPAACVGHRHVCRRHRLDDLAGPILPPRGKITVFIGDRPAARVGDEVQCSCPTTDVIVSGQEDVLIG